MKFTNGYWHIRKGIKPLYAVEYVDHRINGNELIIYAPTKHIDDRSTCVDLPMLTIRLSSPMEDVIKVSLCHHSAALYKGPFVEISNEDTEVAIVDHGDTLTYTSGRLKAVVDKRQKSWGITYYEDGRYLTETSWRNMAYMMDTNEERVYSVEQLSLDVDEYVYGLGERFTPFVKNGQVVEMWNEDGGTASEISYKNIPFYVTNKGYGVFIDNEGDVQFEIGSEKVERIQFSAEGERLDYYMIAGSNAEGVVKKYTDLTGKPALPPAWSFGLWLTTSFTTQYDEETVTSFIQGMADRDIPLHVFHFDCYWMKALEWCNLEWDDETFPDPKGMLERYKSRGLKICVWINPYIAEKSPLFDEGIAGGYFLKKKDQSVFQTDFWQPGAAYIDFTNPEAIKWYQSKLRLLIDMGVDSFKTDFGERIPVRDIEYYDHSDPVKMHNYYTFLYNKAVFELLEEERGKGNAALFARSATAGGQQFPVHWGGDCCATYAAMAETLRGGLSLACGGFGFWSHDIGGFENMATADVYKRWCAFGLLSSHSRLHGSTSYRVPWLFDEEACDVLRMFVKLKCRLMPYLYSQAVIAHQEGIPMHRPMFLAFPGDKACETLDKQYMLGDSLLIAPIFKSSGEVDYYLPQGKWTHYLTGQVRYGGCWFKETLDYFTIPLWVKENSIIVEGYKDQQPSYNLDDGVTIKLSSFTEDGCKTINVPDVDGHTIASITATRLGAEIEMKIDGNLPVWICEFIESDVQIIKTVKTDDGMIITIEE